MDLKIHRWLKVAVLMTSLRFSAHLNGDEVRLDQHSFARPEQSRMTQIHIEIVVDFPGKVIQGLARISFERPKGGDDDSPLILDTRGLTIESVRHGDEEQVPVPYEVGAEVPFLGAALTIHPPKGVDRVLVRYRTTAASTAVQWIEPPGTLGGKSPFLFTQSQAIHARSWIPIQDSPAIRVKYSAKVSVPKGLTAIMSADNKGRTDTREGSTFEFDMPEAVPSYLIALAVGDLAFKPLGKRTGVWAEPAMLERAANEFADTEAMVEAAERRFGPYRWGRYDLLVLPPSFPFGGMENPKLTFATPTVIAGDRSLVSLVAHELAHSWSGNLVTNATWRDFWLNEGFTTYIERRIIEDLFGKERVDMEWALGRSILDEELSSLPPRDQVLHVELAGRDPDEGLTQVPYEKGSLFLRTLEEAYGRERFDPFLKGYFDRFSFQSITTSDFLEYLRDNLLDTARPGSNPIDLDVWIHGAGLPNGVVSSTSNRFALVEQAARDWETGQTAAKSLATREWTTHEWLRFLDTLPPSISEERLAELDEAFGFTERENSEIACQWLQIATRNKYVRAEARLETFLTTIGRRKFLIPLYSELLGTPEGKQRAKTIFAKARSFYHPIARDSIAKLLGDAER